jgi:hypothetical protein
MSPEARSMLIRQQTVICTLSPVEAVATLTDLLPDQADRDRAIAAVEGVAGPDADLGEAARAMLQQLRATLAPPPKPEAKIVVPFHGVAMAHSVY